MPLISDYYCNTCNKVFEYEKFYGEENFPQNPTCPMCKESNTRRKYHFSKMIPDHMKAINN